MLRMVASRHIMRALLLVAAVVTDALLSTGCNLAPDRQLRATFAANQQEFVELASMAEADTNVMMLPSDAGRSPVAFLKFERQQQYQEMFRRLSIRCGMSRRADFPQAIFFCADCNGSAVSRDCKGYVYSTAPRHTTEQDLDAPAPGLHLETLSGGWYLFRDGA